MPDTNFAQSRETTVRILTEARVLLRDRGADHLTITEIARRLGMSHTNVYRFYPSKADLLEKVMTQWLVEREDAVMNALDQLPSPPDRLAAYILAFDEEMRRCALDDQAEFGSFAALCEVAASAMDDHAKRCRARLEAILSDGIARGLFATANVSAVARAIDTATFCLRHPKQVLARLDTASPEEAEDLVVLVLDGIRR